MRHTRLLNRLAVLVLLLVPLLAAAPQTSWAAAPVVNHGGVITNVSGLGIDYPEEITTGPDGALWFANYFGNKIGRITTNGVVTTFTGPMARPVGITAGPDGALWFSNSSATPSGGSLPRGS